MGVRLDILSKFQNESCDNKAIECIVMYAPRWHVTRRPPDRFSPEISHNAAWMHTACVSPMQVLETPDIQHCSRNNGVCVGAPLFISSHQNPRLRVPSRLRAIPHEQVHLGFLIARPMRRGKL